MLDVHIASRLRKPRRTRGGTIQGIGASIDGRRFSDGAILSETTLVDQNIPLLNQTSTGLPSASNDCLPTCGTAIDNSLGGNLTIKDARNWFPNNPEGPIGARDFWNEFSKNTGFTSGGAKLSDIDLLVDFMNSGERISFITNINGGHSVVLDNIVERTIQKVNGDIISKTIYNVMDPAVGQIISWNINTVE